MPIRPEGAAACTATMKPVMASPIPAPRTPSVPSRWRPAAGAQQETPGDDGAGDPGQRQGHERQARRLCRASPHPAHQEWHVGGGAVEGSEREKAPGIGRQENPVLEQGRVDQRLLRPALSHHERSQQDPTQAARPHGVRLQQAAASTRGLERIQQGREAQHQGQRPRHVELVSAPPATRLAQVAVDQPPGSEPERDVQVEDPAPAGVLDESAPHGRPDHAGNAPHGGENTLHARPLLEGVEIPHQGQRHRDQRAGSETLKRPHGHEKAHAGRGPRQRGAGEEEAEPDEVEGLPTSRVGEAAADRRHHRGGEEVGREDPGVECQASKVGHHAGHRGRHDQYVQGGKEDAEQQSQGD